MRVVACAGALVLGLLAAPAAAEPPALEASVEVSDTGAYRLSWKPNGVDVTLQEATRQDFAGARTLYRGPDGATVVSGRLDGTYFYRVRREGDTWSAPVLVTVAHHGLGKAFAFLATGAVVFLATVVLILAGHHRHRRAA